MLQQVTSVYLILDTPRDPIISPLSLATLCDQGNTESISLTVRVFAVDDSV
jgi:hypothetical protein